MSRSNGRGLVRRVLRHWGYVPSASLDEMLETQRRVYALAGNREVKALKGELADAAEEAKKLKQQLRDVYASKNRAEVALSQIKTQLKNETAYRTILVSSHEAMLEHLQVVAANTLWQDHALGHVAHLWALSRENADVPVGLQVFLDRLVHEFPPVPHFDAWPRYRQMKGAEATALAAEREEAGDG